MKYVTQTTGSTIDVQTAQGLIDMFAAYEEVRNLNNRTEEETTLVNLDTEYEISAEHIHEARIYPHTPKKHTIELAQLNIDEIWQTCIMCSRVAYQHAATIMKKSVRFIVAVDDAIASFLQAIDREIRFENDKTVRIRKRTQLRVAHVGGDEVRVVPVRVAVEQHQTKQRSNVQVVHTNRATSIQMFLFVTRLVAQKMWYGKYMHSVDK